MTGINNLLESIGTLMMDRNVNVVYGDELRQVVDILKYVKNFDSYALAGEIYQRLENEYEISDHLKMIADDECEVICHINDEIEMFLKTS